MTTHRLNFEKIYNRLGALEAEIAELKAVGYKTKPAEVGTGGSGNVYNEAGNVLQENNKSVNVASNEQKLWSDKMIETWKDTTGHKTSPVDQTEVKHTPKKRVRVASYEEDEDRVISSNRIRTKANNYQFTPVRFASYDEAIAAISIQLPGGFHFEFEADALMDSEYIVLHLFRVIQFSTRQHEFRAKTKKRCIEKAFEYYNWKII